MKARSILTAVIFTTVFSVGCSGTHAIECIDVGEQKVCFVREVWGLNGDEVSLTTSNNVCHEPSKENDYVSSSMRGQEKIPYKIKDGKLHIYAEPMDVPTNKFSVEVVLEDYEPYRDVEKEDYQKANLSSDKMTWCLNDVF